MSNDQGGRLVEERWSGLAVCFSPVSALEATQARLRAANVEPHEAGEADVVQRIRR